MRELSVIESKVVAGALSTSDILDFFRNLGNTPSNKQKYVPPDIEPNPTLGVLVGAAVLAAAALGVLGLLGVSTLLNKKSP